MKAEVTVRLSDLNEVKDALREAADYIELLRGLISDLTDDESCSYDHHGYCQTHGWFDDETTCPHARAKRIAS